MRRVPAGCAALVSIALLCGCGGKTLPPSEEAAVRAAIEKHYAARKDSKREVDIKEIAAAPEGAKARVSVKYPDFHTVATEHVLRIRKTADGWKVDDKADRP